MEPQMQQERVKDRLRVTEQQRLVRQVRAARPKPIRFYNPILVLLGRRLVAVGTRLQAQYGAFSDASVVSTTGSTATPC
jgi:hypothetical protein